MNEVFVTSSLGESVELIKVWDSKTGTCLMTYRDSGVIAPKGLCILGSDYVIAVDKFKPLLKVWPINSQQILHYPRLLCPGRVSVLATSPDACYIAVSIVEKLHVYQVSSGRLVGSGVHHFQPITVIRWCCDGSILSCGGEDGMVTVWYLSNLMNHNSAVNPDPLYTFSDHTLPVTDLILTSGGSSCNRSRLASVSCDRTCKIYELSSGKLLLSIVFGEMLTSVSMTPTEMEIFVGMITGDINEFSLRNPKNPASSEIHVNTGLSSQTNDIINVFSGHEKSVTCLSTSLEGDKLLSGSADETIRIWHIPTKQCLKVLLFKGSVTNAFFIKMPKQMLEQDFKTSLVLNPFQKSTDVCDEIKMHIVCNNDLNVSNYDIHHDNLVSDYLFNKNHVSNGISSNEDDCSLTDEVKRLRGINEQLFKICMKQQLCKRIDNEDKNEELDDSNKNDSDIGDSNNSESITKVDDNRSLENGKLKNKTIDIIFSRLSKSNKAKNKRTKKKKLRMKKHKQNAH